MNAPAVLFPAAESVVVAYATTFLAERYDPAPTVGTRVPDPRPTPFVLVRRLGGPRSSFLEDNPTIGFEVWDDDEVDAELLAQELRAGIFAMRGQVVEGVTIGRIEEFAGPQLLPDGLTDTPRYVFTEAIRMRGSALPAPDLGS